MKKLMVAMAGMIAAGLATAATSFSYQGVLRGATGEAVSVKNQVISFKIYDGPASETALWGRKCSVLLDDDGLFNVELSDAAGSAIEGLDQELDAVIAAHAGATLYIGLTVQGSSGEIRPRQKILSVPLASYAYDVSLAKRDFTVTGKATFNATETTGNAVINGTNTVKTLSVTDGAVLAGDVRVTGELNLTGGSLAMPSDSTFTIGGVSAVLPKGVIVMWSGSQASIPSGWALCNGQNGTPDLRDRFIVGAGRAYGVGATGGAQKVTLNVMEIPSHTHNYFGDDQLSVRANVAYYSSGYDADSEKSGNAAYFITSSTGGSQPHENRPPYYALCFIIKL